MNIVLQVLVMCSISIDVMIRYNKGNDVTSL